MATDPKRKHSVLVVVIAVLAAVVGVACSGGDDALTVGEVYERMLAGMTEEDSVLHSVMTIEVVDENGELVGSQKSQFWIDVPSDFYREERSLSSSLDTESEPLVRIYAQGQLYVPDEARPVGMPAGALCPGSDSHLLAGLLNCETLLLYSDTEPTIEIDGNAKFGDRDALAIHLTLPSRDGVEESTLEMSLIVDPETYLPMAFGATEGDFGASGIRSYAHEFIPRDELPDDWFDHGLDE